MAQKVLVFASASVGAREVEEKVEGQCPATEPERGSGATIHPTRARLGSGRGLRHATRHPRGRCYRESGRQLS